MKQNSFISFPVKSRHLEIWRVIFLVSESSKQHFFSIQMRSKIFPISKMWWEHVPFTNTMDRLNSSKNDRHEFPVCDEIFNLHRIRDFNHFGPITFYARWNGGVLSIRNSKHAPSIFLRGTPLALLNASHCEEKRWIGGAWFEESRFRTRRDIDEGGLIRGGFGLV